MQKLYEIQGKRGKYKDPQQVWLTEYQASKFSQWGYRVVYLGKKRLEKEDGIRYEKEKRLGISPVTQDVKAAKRAHYTQDELAESAILRQRKDRPVISPDDIIDVMLALEKGVESES